VPGKPVVVRGRVLGNLDASGVYKPTLQGRSAPQVQFQFGVSKANGQYRINSLPAGVLVDERQFLGSYSQRSLYFFDLAQRYLVADPRWTSITDPSQLSTWLMTQLAGGPSDLLANAVSSDTLPTQTATENITVTFGNPIKIEIPGSSQLDGGARDRLAAQVATTLADAARGQTLVITDGGTPVSVPDASGSQFTASEFGDTSVQPPPPEVYYLRGGRVVDSNGRRLGGAIGNAPFLTSIAASRSAPGGGLVLAGVSLIDNSPTLLVGSQLAGLRPTTVRGVTSRPAYAPDRDEVWVGAGTQIVRVPVSGTHGTPSTVTLPASANGGKIMALRLSPEGSRIAVVIQDPSGHQQQLFVGAVVRTGDQVRIDTLQPISPAGVVITDLAWVERLKLYAIGYDTPSGNARLYSTGVDGSSWDAQGIGHLPDPPTTLSISLGQPGWVTSQDAVWVQSGGSTWDSPGAGTRTPGLAPTYLE
jgi:hypothetical protein